MPRRKQSPSLADRLTADVLRGIAIGFALGIAYMIAFAPAEGPSPLIARELPGLAEQQQLRATMVDGGVGAIDGGDDCNACLDSLHDCLSTRHDDAWVTEHDRLRQAENEKLAREIDFTARALRHLKRDVKSGKACGR